VVNCCHTAATEAGVVESVDNPTQEQEHQSFLSGEVGTLAHKPVCCLSKQQQVLWSELETQPKSRLKKCPIPQRGKFSLGESGSLAHKHVCRNFKVPDSLEPKLSAPGNPALQHKSLQAVCCHTAEAAEVQQSMQRLSIMHGWSRRIWFAMSVLRASKLSAACLRVVPT
jgi:hypothetical protein